MGIQYWTSRGFGVVDVNYGGSSGYGRAYRERLRRQWGIVDTDDCISAARYLADSGEVDGRRLAIRGGSAGGYTTLCALIFHDDFAAGASYYGVADCEALATDTHKFESRYLDGLIGPYPGRASSTGALADPLRGPTGVSGHPLPGIGRPRGAAVPGGDDGCRRCAPSDCRWRWRSRRRHGFRKAATSTAHSRRSAYLYSRVFGFRWPTRWRPSTSRTCLAAAKTGRGRAPAAHRLGPDQPHGGQHRGQHRAGGRGGSGRRSGRRAPGGPPRDGAHRVPRRGPRATRELRRRLASGDPRAREPPTSTPTASASCP